MRRSVMLLAVWCVAVIVRSQPPETNENVPNGSPRRRGPEPGNERPPVGRPGFGNEPGQGAEPGMGEGMGFRRGGFFRDAPTSGPGAGFKPLMLSEISHLPLLESKVKA